MKVGLGSLTVLAMGVCGMGTAQAATSDPDPAEVASLSTLASAEATEATQPATEAPEASSRTTEVILTPYVWLAATKGSVGFPRFNQTVDVDRSFSDTLEDLDFAFMAALEVRHRRLVLLTDVMYMDLSARADNIRDRRFLSGRVDAEVLMGSAAAGYRVVDEGPMYADVFAGARVLSLDVGLNLAAGPLTFSRSASPTNVAPLIGARARVPLGGRWAFGAYADVSDIFSDSAVRGQVLTTVQYDLGSRWRASAGYRYLSIDKDAQRLLFDVNLSGPILGVSYRF